MTADDFLTWAARLPDSLGLELVAGRVVRKERQTVGMVRARGCLVATVLAATRQGALGCEAFGRGLAVRAGRDTMYEPDLIVRKGGRLPGSALEVRDPVVIGEVVRDDEGMRWGTRLADYMSLSSVRHCLLVTTLKRTVMHHARRDNGSIETRIVRSGPLVLDPPGIEVTVESFFED